MAEYIEGKRAVLEALQAGASLRCIIAADNLQADRLTEEVLQQAGNLNIPVRKMPRKSIDALASCKANQGLIAEAAPFVYTAFDSLLAAAGKSAEADGGGALLVVLDHLTDVGNIGAIVRSAESVGASGLIIPNRRASRITAATYKSSAGAVAHLPVAQVANIAHCLESLKKDGFWIVAASEHARDVIWDTDLSGKIALVFGNEEKGVSRLALDRSDFAVSLPQRGRLSSLNVASAAAVCMYEWLRQNRAVQKDASAR